MIDRNTVDRVLDAANIVDVIQDFMPLKKQGVNYKGLCPFHNEKTPSFTVSPAKGIFKCFGCGESGNSASFVMKHENFSFVEAIKYLGKKYNIEVQFKEETQEDIEQKNKLESLMIVSNFANEYFQRSLKETEQGKSIGLSYFKERGIREDLIEKFQLGYSPELRDAFSKEAISKGYKEEFLTETGLSIRNENGLFDRFRGRVIFPIHNLTGRVIAFGGRTLRTDKKIAKYLNSPESEIYHKSKVLYGIHQAKKGIIQNEKCYLVEGYTDVIGLHQVGIENVVASSGTALTVDQIRLISRFTENITVLYDGDVAGIKASLRGIDLILQEGMNVRVVLFPDGEDPDSYSKSHSSSEVLEFLQQNEQDFILFKTGLLKEEAKNDPIAKGNLVRDIIRSIALIPDRIKRSMFIKSCSTQLEIKEEILYSEIGKILRKKTYGKEGYQPEYKNPPVTQTQKAKTSEYNLDQHYEKEFIRILVKYMNEKIQVKLREQNPFDTIVGPYMIQSIENEETLRFRTPVYAKIFNILAQQLKSEGELNVKILVNNEDLAISSLTADILAQEYNLSKMWSKKENFVETEKEKLNDLVPETIIALKYYRIQVILEELGEKLKDKISDEEMIRTLGIIKTLKETHKVLSQYLGDRIVF